MFSVEKMIDIQFFLLKTKHLSFIKSRMNLIDEQFKQFLRFPNTKYDDHPKSILRAYKLFFIFDFKLFFIWGVLAAIMSLLFKDFSKVISSQIDLNHSLILTFMLMVILMPFLEEIAFRLSLKINRINIAISLGVQTLFFLMLLDLIDWQFLYNILFIIFTTIFIFFLIGDKTCNFLKKHLNYFVYYNILLFGLMHAFNYNYASFHQYFYIPFLISFQTVLGAYFSYVRLKHGFFFNLSCHIIHNLILTLPFFLIRFFDLSYKINF